MRPRQNILSLRSAQRATNLQVRHKDFVAEHLVWARIIMWIDIGAGYKQLFSLAMFESSIFVCQSKPHLKERLYIHFLPEKLDLAQPDD